MQALSKRLIPLFDRVLLEKVPPVMKTSGGILLPDSAQSKLNEFKVVAVGKGRRKPDGDFVKPLVKEGDSVLVAEGYAGTEVKMAGDKTYFLYREDDILGLLKE